MCVEFLVEGILSGIHPLLMPDRFPGKRCGVPVAALTTPHSRADTRGCEQGLDPDKGILVAGDSEKTG